MERFVMELESKFETYMLKEVECEVNGWKKKERRWELNMWLVWREKRKYKEKMGAITT